MSSEQYNGWHNWATWNVALWILNDEGIYERFVDLCRRNINIGDIVDELFPSGETPDGAKVEDASIAELQRLKDDERTFFEEMDAEAEEHDDGTVNYCGNYVVMAIPRDAVDDIARPGRNDEAVEYWVGRVDWSDTSPDDIVRELRETGLDPDVYEGDEQEEQALRYFLWHACHCIRDAEQE